MRRLFENKLPLLLAGIAMAVICGGCAKNTLQDDGPKPAEGATVSAKHILVMYKGSERASPDITRTKEEAKALIDEILVKVKNGEKFEDLATEYSDCTSAAKGGDLGAFTRGKMTAAFEEASFACPVGETTGIVETPFGYHIIYRYK